MQNNSRSILRLSKKASQINQQHSSYSIVAEAFAKLGQNDQKHYFGIFNLFDVDLFATGRDCLAGLELRLFLIAFFITGTRICMVSYILWAFYL